MRKASPDGDAILAKGLNLSMKLKHLKNILKSSNTDTTGGTL
jgi:hypothetical protein